MLQYFFYIFSRFFAELNTALVVVVLVRDDLDSVDRLDGAAALGEAGRAVCGTGSAADLAS
jgi:hypothetical protein